MDDKRDLPTEKVAKAPIRLAPPKLGEKRLEVTIPKGVTKPLRERPLV